MRDFEATPVEGAATPAQPLLPENLAFLTQERPLLWYEREEEYDALRGAVFAELDPRGVWETILTKDLVDYIWEVRRMRRLKLAATHAEMPEIAGAMLAKTGSCLSGNYSEKVRIRYLARAAVARAGDAEGSETLSDVAGPERITPEVLHYEAHKSAAEHLDAISREITRLEARRRQILAEFEERRASVAAMARGLIAREAATVLDMAAQP